MLKIKNTKLNRRQNGMMALEQRFMFDGAAVDTFVTADQVDHAPVEKIAADRPIFVTATPNLDPAIQLVFQQTQQQIKENLAQWSDAQWAEVFKLNLEDSKVLQTLHSLQESLANGTYDVEVVNVDASQMGFSMAAFAVNGPGGKPTIFLNKTWWTGAENDPNLNKALIEEFGHSLDAVLNSNNDTRGDEGELFAARVLGVELSNQDLSRIQNQNDSGLLTFEGQTYEVEHASFNFTTAYAIAPEYRYYAEKEQESNRFLGQSLGVASITDNTSSGTFSGNDVVVDLTINGTTYHGWISRPIKDQGVVRGFYFWYDPQFNSFATATADGNQDGDANDVDNQGFVLVVDQAWFSAITAGTAVHNNGSVNTNVYEVGSSSDRVDSALNGLAPVNAAPVANTDTSNVSLSAGVSGGPALEAGGLSNATAGANAIGNVLTNDTDSNSDTLKVTAVGVNTASSSVAASSTSTSNGRSITGSYGTLTIGANGSYQYVVDNSNLAVQALRLTSNTLTDSFTYTIADPSGLTSSAKINIVVQGANDTPVAANDYNNAKESLLADTNTSQYTSTDPLGFKATGNVLTNDSDIDGNAETKSISGLSISGSATGTSSGAGSSVTKLSFSSLPGNVAVGYYVFLDGDNTANNNSGSLTALQNGSTQLTVSSIDSVNKTFTLSGAVTNVVLSGSSILGFANKANGTGAYKDSSISTTPTTTSTTNVTLSGTITGTIAVGMTESSTGATVASVTYSSSTGKATDVTLQGTYSFTGQALSFTGSGSTGQTMTGQYGSLILNADGTYEYTPTANNSTIGTGQSFTEAFAYTMKDALNATSNATLYINVQGSSASDPNAIADTATAVEAGGINNGTAGTNPTGNLLTNDTTPSGTNAVYSAASINDATATTIASNTQIVGTYGTLTLSTTGAYTYTVNNNNTAVQALHGSSNTLSEVFRYTIRNGVVVSSNNLSDTSTVTFTIQGANDTPVASNDSATATEASGYLNNIPGYNPSGNVLSNDSDVDDSASALVVSAVRTGSTEGSGTAGTVGTALTGQYGSLTLNADGSWTYTVNNSNATVNALTSGQTLTDSFNYTVKDSSGAAGGLTDIAVLNVTIEGADDTLSVNNIFVNEASPYAVFTVSGASGMTVQLALGNTVGAGALSSGDRLASLGTDTAATGTLQYLSGTTWVTYNSSSPPVIPSGNQLLVRIAVTQDTQHEGNESFTLTATSGSQTAVGIGTINDEGDGDLYPNNTTGNKDTTSTKDDDRPLISIGTSSATEGNDLVFTASLSNASAYPISFTPTLSGVTGSATIGTDTAAANTLQVSYDNGTTWATVSGAVTFNAGQTSIKFKLATVDDVVNESSENIYLSTSNTTGVVRNQTDVNGEGIIIDNDGPPSYAISDESVNEGAGTITFTVTRGGDSSATGTVDYAVVPGTATLADYSASSALSGTVSFGVGETSKTIVLNVTNDSVYEGSEQFVVNLSNPTGASGVSISDTQGIGTITDDGTGNGGSDDDRPVITVAGVADVSEGSYSVFTVTLNKALAADTNIKLQLADGTAVMSSDLNSSTMQVVTSLSTAIGSGTSVNNGSNFTLAAGTQTFYVRVLTKSDTTYEGSENFSLTASFVTSSLLYADRTGTSTTLRTGASASDTSTILDNGSGKVYDGLGGDTGTPDDDRTLTVSSVTVNEGSPYAVFTVTGAANQLATLALGGQNSDGANLSTLQYFDGTTWQNYTSGANVTLNSSGTILVRVALSPEQEAALDGPEAFNLVATNTGGTAATGVGTIVDDGTGSYFDATNNTSTSDVPTGIVLDDDRALTVSSVTVNEGSPYAVFTVTGAANQLATLSLGGQNSDGANLSTLQYFDGTTWQNYTSGATVTLNSNGTILVRVALSPEQEAALDGPETFNLVATNTGGTAASGVGTIVDDGTGSYFDATNNTSTSDVPSGVTLDNDNISVTALTVSSVTVNEGSPYAVFTVTGVANQLATLALGGQNSDGANLSALQYFDGTTWQNYTAGATVALNSSGTILVRVALSPEQEAALDGPETFNLVATNTGGAAATGVGTIVDDGTGSYFAADNNSATSSVPSGVILDDDRALTVSSVTVNEGSPYAVFTVTGAANQLATLALSGQNSDGANLSALQYFDGTTWQNYTAGATVALNSSGTILVRVALSPEQEAALDGPETFNLVATNTGGTAATGVGTIVDDGTGSYFAANNNSATSSVPSGVILDDDRALTLSSVTVNEGSPYAVFTVTGAANQLATLALSGQNTDGANLSALQYFDGTTWQNYTAGSTVTLNSSGTILVRVALSPEQEAALDGPETFNLVATNTGGTAATGVGTIVDDGTGSYFAADNNSATSAVPSGVVLDDDNPKPAPKLAEPIEVALANQQNLTPPQIVATSTVPGFSSALNPISNAIVVAEPPRSLVESVTSGSGYQIPVSETAPIGLTLYQGVTDQFVQSTNVTTKVSLPFDAFIHSNKDAVIKLDAKQADDSPLPNWVQFDPASGVFEVTPPASFKGKLNLKVIARDDDGREAVAIFQMFVGEQTSDRPQGRSSFTDKLRMVSNRPLTLIHVTDFNEKITVRESKPIKARVV